MAPSPDSIGSYSERTFCPRCGDRLNIQNVRIAAPFICPACGVTLSVSPLYRATTVLISVAGSLFFSVGIKAYAAIAWIPLFMIALILVPNFGKFAVPPKLQVCAEVQTCTRKERWQRHLQLFLSFWLGLTLYLIAYGYVWTWIEFLLGGSPRDIREANEMWSVPLGWVNSAFVITPTRSVPAVFGIVCANSFFYAAVLTATVKIVQARIRQQQITRLGISSDGSQPNHESDGE